MKDRSLLLLALLLAPLALYLMILGWINRRPRPVLTAGTWEFAGVLFALSGFVLAGGPALLSGLDEQSRWFWLLGESGQTKSSFGDDSGPAWLVIRLAYFAAVAGGAAAVLWRSRRLTSVYNVDPLAFLPAVEHALRRLGLLATRTGDAFLIAGQAPEVPDEQGDAVQLARSVPRVGAPPGPRATLHIDIFTAMRHATLRWDPDDFPLRREVELELARRLAEAAPPGQESLLGGCLSLLGGLFFVATLVAAGLLVLFRLYPPR